MSDKRHSVKYRGSVEKDPALELKYIRKWVDHLYN